MSLSTTSELGMFEFFPPVYEIVYAQMELLSNIHVCMYSICAGGSFLCASMRVVQPARRHMRLHLGMLHCHILLAAASPRAFFPK
jgi:hypothetical protein